MSLIRWLFNKGKRKSDDSPADKRTEPDLAVRFGALSHEVSEDEFSLIKAERKLKAKEWAALGHVEQQRRIVQGWRAKGLENRKQLKALGITQYKWRWVPNTGHECDACKENNGKIFSFDNPPNGSHPGDGYCCPDGYCKCSARAIIPGFED